MRLRTFPTAPQRRSNSPRFETHPISYPNILGQSFSGVIETVGSGVTDLSPGDRVAVLRPHHVASDPRFGSYQRFALASAGSTSKLRACTSLEDGAATIVNLATVTSALTVYMGLLRPSLAAHPPQRRGKILIYGGSSSCGWLATSYAKSSGYSIVTTSSPKNHGLVQTLGPDHIIDHTQSPNAILNDLIAYGPYDKIFDAIGLPPVTTLLTRYLSSLASPQKYHSVVPLLGGEEPMPETIQRVFAPYSQAFEEPQNAELKRWFFEELLPRGLESGHIKPTPVRKVEGGLERVQEALDMMARSEQSCEKLILDPWA